MGKELSEMSLEELWELFPIFLGMLTAYAKEHPDVDIEIITPHVDNMRRLLKQI